jgi:hypothetical protein
MNYREWLLFRARQHEIEAVEPEVLRYTRWQNYQAERDWIRRSGAAQGMKLSRPEYHTGWTHG